MEPDHVAIEIFDARTRAVRSNVRDRLDHFRAGFDRAVDRGLHRIDVEIDRHALAGATLGPRYRWPLGIRSRLPLLRSGQSIDRSASGLFDQRAGDRRFARGLEYRVGHAAELDLLERAAE